MYTARLADLMLIRIINSVMEAESDKYCKYAFLLFICCKAFKDFSVATFSSFMIVLVLFSYFVRPLPVEAAKNPETLQDLLFFDRQR